MTDPFEKLEENMEDVGRLMEIHREEAGPLRGRKFDVEVLNKSGVVLTHACWEAFVEDCATEAFAHLVARIPDPNALPTGVRKLVARRVKDDIHELSVWRLAGTGWRTELIAFREDIIAKYVGPLNTPNPANVDKLYESLLDLKGLSTNWKWHRMSASELAQGLIAFTSLRGDIAHRNASTRSVTKVDVTRYRDYVIRIAGITSNKVREHLFRLTASYPWEAKPEPGRPGRPREKRGPNNEPS